MRRWLAALAFTFAALAAGAATAQTAGPFSNWAAVVVSGDFHAAHTNNPTETFDNARRDVSAELIRKGFSAANLREFSVRPELYPDLKPGKADLQPIYQSLTELAQHATAGCLIYFSSHGAPQGVVLNGQILPPQIMDQMISSACGRRPDHRDHLRLLLRRLCSGAGRYEPHDPDGGQARPLVVRLQRER